MVPAPGSGRRVPGWASLGTWQEEGDKAEDCLCLCACALFFPSFFYYPHPQVLLLLLECLVLLPVLRWPNCPCCRDKSWWWRRRRIRRTRKRTWCGGRVAGQRWAPVNGALVASCGILTLLTAMSGCATCCFSRPFALTVTGWQVSLGGVCNVLQASHGPCLLPITNHYLSTRTTLPCDRVSWAIHRCALLVVSGSQIPSLLYGPKGGRGWGLGKRDRRSYPRGLLFFKGAKRGEGVGFENGPKAQPMTSS